MHIDEAQFTKMLYAVQEKFPPTDGVATLSPAEAELVVAIAGLVIAADRVDDPDERALFDQLAGHLYKHANVATDAPHLDPTDDDDRRHDQLRSHAQQLRGKPSGALAYALAYVLSVSDMSLDPSEGALLEVLRDALGLDEAAAEAMLPVVSELITPVEHLE